MTETGTGVAASVVAVDMKLEVVVIPISDTKRAKGFLRQAWLAAGRDTGRIRGRAAYTTRLRLLGAVRRKSHHRGTRIRARTLVDRVRPPGRVG